MASKSFIEIVPRDTAAEWEKILRGYGREAERSVTTALRETGKRTVDTARRNIAKRTGIVQKVFRTRFKYFGKIKGGRPIARAWIGGDAWIRPREHSDVEAIARARGFKKIIIKGRVEYIRTFNGKELYFALRLKDENIDAILQAAAQSAFPARYNEVLKREARTRLRRLKRKGLLRAARTNRERMLRKELEV